MTAVVFDIGNVLIEWDVKALYRQLLPDDEAIDAFLKETELLALNIELDRGLPFEQGIASLAARHPHHFDLVHAFKDRWAETLVGPIVETFAILEALRANAVPTYAITNFSAETWPIAVGRFSFLRTHFDDVVVSGELGLIKPDPKIYTALLSRNGLAPEDCFFIDDTLANVEGARAVGMRAHHFTITLDLRRDLIHLGVMV
jgi:2-haloacid dehalogenase